jgi:hypothetical protein
MESRHMKLSQKHYAIIIKTFTIMSAKYSCYITTFKFIIYTMLTHYKDNGPQHLSL